MSALSNGWTYSTLAELGKWCGGGTPSKSNPEFWHDGTIPWVSPKDMKVDNISDAEDRITEEAVEASSAKVVPSGSVLIVSRSGILRRTLPVAITTSPVAINQDIKALQPAGHINHEYIAWWLRRDEQSILRECSKDGTTVDSINFSEFLQRKIPLAPPDEQKRIVAYLEQQFSRLDAGITYLERCQQNMVSMRAAIMQRLANSGFVEVRADVNISNGMLPQLHPEWRWAQFGELISAGPQNGIYLPASRYGDGLPILRINDFQNEFISGRTELRVAVPNPGQEKLFSLSTGDLVINRVNSMTHLGKCLVAGPNLEGVLFESNMMRIKLSGEVDREYVKFYLQSPLGRKFLLANAKHAVNQASINQSDVRRTPIPLPPLCVQKDLVATCKAELSSLSSLTASVRTSRRRSGILRKSILATAFTGRLIPSSIC